MKGACQCFVFAKSVCAVKTVFFDKVVFVNRPAPVCLSSSKVKLEHASTAIKRTRNNTGNVVEQCLKVRLKKSGTKVYLLS
mgnify:CR=1 FL=1